MDGEVKRGEEEKLSKAQKGGGREARQRDRGGNVSFPYLVRIRRDQSRPESDMRGRILQRGGGGGGPGGGF